MNKQIYMVIEAHPDGDNYQIHSNLKEARTAFTKEKENCSVFGDSTFYLIEIKDPKSFGFGTRGEFYGGEVIEEFKIED